jgi:hypothetical protein
MPIYYYKFGFIAICFIIAAYYRKPYPALFTLIADYFLLIGAGRFGHEIGVTVFCIAHVCYAMRFSAGDKRLLHFYALFICGALLFVNIIGGGYLYFAAALYTQCFALSLYTALRGVFTKSYPYINGRLIAAGMTLFALCDICVLLYNTVFIGSHGVLVLIWMFYLPSQLLLAVSAKSLSDCAKRKVAKTIINTKNIKRLSTA